MSDSNLEQVIIAIDDQTTRVLSRGVRRHERPAVPPDMLFGNVIYLNFGWNSDSNGKYEEELYLPRETVLQIGQAAALGKQLVMRDSSGQLIPFTAQQLESLINIAQNVQDIVTYSPAIDYSCAWITGDVGEIRKVKLDGEEKEVLVIPQAMLRAEANAANIRDTNMSPEHPLNDSRRMLEVMALLMYRNYVKSLESGDPDKIIRTPYFRLKGMADGQNGATLGHDTFHTTVGGTVWRFFKQPSHSLAPNHKVAVVSPNRISGDRIFQNKVTSIYQSRIKERTTLLLSDRSKRANAVDTSYMLPNGVLADLSCQNIAYWIKNNDTDRYKLIFVEGSEGNYYFEGKTHKVAYDIVSRAAKQLGFDAVKVSSPEQFAEEAGYTHDDAEAGASLTYKVIKEKVKGMLAMGTFRGIETLSGILPEEGYHIGNEDTDGNAIIFEWSDSTWAVTKKLQEEFWKATFGIKGGNQFTAEYCTMFDTADLAKGVVTPIDLLEKNIEDIIHT